MSGTDDQGKAGRSETEETPPPKIVGAQDGAAAGERKRSPLLRIARLDGRDTLKYEDTADK